MTVKTPKPQIGSIVKLAEHAVADIKNINRFGLGIVLETMDHDGYLSARRVPMCKVYQFSKKSFLILLASQLEVISQ